MKVSAYLKLSIAVAVATIALKTGAWWFTGSVGLLSDAMESVVNLAGAMFALAMVTIAARPPDDRSRSASVTQLAVRVGVVVSVAVGSVLVAGCITAGPNYARGDDAAVAFRGLLFPRKPGRAFRGGPSIDTSRSATGTGLPRGPPT